MPFLTDLELRLISDRSPFPWMTTQSLKWQHPDTGQIFESPKYFRTDGASIPFAVACIPVLGPLLVSQYFGAGLWLGFREGVLHDFITKGPVPMVGKHEAVEIFRIALTESGYTAQMIDAYCQGLTLYNRTAPYPYR